MVPCEDLSSVSRYPVEVSGWDSQQRFFVEKCDLAWDEDRGKQVELCHRLPERALLFVRLLQTEEGERPGPVVYEAEWVGSAANGQQQFQLSAVVPVVRDREVPVSVG
jgi:hypothetical protein